MFAPTKAFLCNYLSMDSFDSGDTHAMYDNYCLRIWYGLIN